MKLIVVGVDGSAHSNNALRWAVDIARRNGAAVRAVYAWHVPSMAVLPGAFGSPVPPADLMAAAADEAVAGFVTAAELAADVTVDGVAREGSAAAVLLAEAKGADLLVVGARGHEGIVGALVGSVASQVSHHSPVPVAIIP